MKTTISKGLHTGLFYILITLISFVKAERSQYAPTEHCYYSSPVEIELVITTETEHDLSLFGCDTPSKWSENFAVTHIDFITRYKFTLIQYDSYVRHQLKSLKYTPSSNHELISILQKHNIWHQSSDEDPFCG